jgi:hypothetical protein
VLEGLEGDVQKTLQSIQKGLSLLDDRRVALTAPPIAVEGGNGELVEDEAWDDEAEEPAAPARM